MNAVKTSNVDALLEETRKLIQEGKDFLLSEGKVVEMSKWLSITEYAEKYNVTTQLVSKWIERGVITKDDYIEVGKFGKRLVRDFPYKA